MGQSSHNEVVLFHLRDLPTQPPLPARLGKCALIIQYEAFKQEERGEGGQGGL